MAINMGELVYTVGVPRSSLQKLRNDLNGVRTSIRASTSGSVSKVNRLTDAYKSLSLKVRTARQDFQDKRITGKQLDQRMTTLRASAHAFREELEEMRRAGGLSSAEMLQLDKSVGILSRTSSAATRTMDQASGKIARLGLASQVSLGATSLLNDQIFRMSPALGILTGRLQQATGGFMAFAAIAGVVVAVGGVILGVAASIRKAANAGIALESAMADVTKTTNLTNEEMGELLNTFQRSTRVLPVTTNELLDIAAVAGQLGIKGVDNIARFSDTIARLSIATDVVGEEGATSLARFLQATGAAAEDLGAAAEQTGNVLNILENTTASTASEILQMTQNTAGLATQSDLTRNEILAVNATLLELGVRSEAGGTAITRLFSDIQVAGSVGGDELTKLANAAGVTTEEFQSLSRYNPAEAMVTLASGLKEAKDAGGDLNLILNDLGITQVRQRRAVLALVQGNEKLAASIENANREAIEQMSLNREVEKRSDTVANQMQILANKFNVLFEVLGVLLLPALGALVDMLNSVLEPLADWALNISASKVALEKFREEVNNFNKEIDTTRSHMELLNEVTTKRGLIEAIGNLASTLNEEGRKAMVEFAEATVMAVDSEEDLQAAIYDTMVILAQKRQVQLATREEELYESASDVERSISEGRNQLRNIKRLIIDQHGDLVLPSGELLGGIDTARWKETVDEMNLGPSKAGLELLVDNYTQLQRDLAIAGGAAAGTTNALFDTRIAFGELKSATDAFASGSIDFAEFYESAFGTAYIPLGSGPAAVGRDSGDDDPSNNPVAKEIRTAQNVFDDLAAAGYLAVRRAEAFGNSQEKLAAKIDSVKTRSGLVSKAITELISMGVDPMHKDIQYLVTRLSELEVEAAELAALQSPKDFEIAIPTITPVTPKISPIEDYDFLTNAEFGSEYAGPALKDKVTGLESIAKGFEVVTEAMRDGEITISQYSEAVKVHLSGARTNWSAYREQMVEANAAADASLRVSTQALKDYRDSLISLHGAGMVAAETQTEWADLQSAALAKTNAQIRENVSENSNRAAILSKVQEASQGVAGWIKTLIHENNIHNEGLALVNEAQARNAKLMGETVDPIEAQIAALEGLIKAYPMHSDLIQQMILDLREYEEATNEVAGSTSTLNEVLDDFYDNDWNIGEHNKQMEEWESTLAAARATLGDTTNVIDEQIEALIEYAKTVGLTSEEVDKINRTIAGLRIMKVGEAFRDVGNLIDGIASKVANATAGVIDGIAIIVAAGGTAEEQLEGILTGVSAIGQALVGLIPKQDSAINKLTEGFFSAGGAVAELITGIPGIGAAVTTVGQVVSSVLGNMVNGFERTKKAIEGMADSYDYLSEELISSLIITERVSRGGFLGLLGLTYESINEETKQLGISIANGIANGMANAMQASTLEEFSESFSESIKGIVMNAVIEAAMMTGAMQEQIAALTRTIIAALEDGVIKPLEQASIQAGMEAVRIIGETYWEQLQKLEQDVDARGNIITKVELDPVSMSLLERELASLRRYEIEGDTGPEANRIRARIAEIEKELEEEKNKDKNPKGKTRPAISNSRRRPRQPLERAEKTTAGSSINEITGATRDLLTDLLRPLAYLPSLIISMNEHALVQNNYLAQIAANTHSMVTGEELSMPVPNYAGGLTSVSPNQGYNGGGGITIGTANIYTQATDANTLFKEISRFIQRRNRGG